MAWLRNLSLRSKLLLMLLPLGLISMGTQAILSHINNRKAMLDRGFETTVAVRQSKKQQIEAVFRNLRDTFPIFGDNVAVVAATAQFRDAFGQLGRVRISDDRRASLEAYYKTSFVPSLVPKTAPGEQVLFENVWPRTDRAIEAQTLFIAENTFKKGERSRLVDHPRSTPYTLAHFTYHGWFRDVASRMKLYDLMLVDADTGSMIYSVEKEPDFGTSLIDGPYANTNIGRLFRRVLAEHKKGYVAFADFESYVPSGLVPSMFIATPVYANFKLTGVLIGQISAEEINRALNGDKSWLKDGLGQTGLAYIAGTGKLIRNDHRFFIENRDGFLQQLKSLGSNDALVANLQRGATTILKLPMNVEAVDRAQRGETGTMLGRNVINQPALQAYAPLDIPDVSWALVTQINQAEVLAPVNESQRNMMLLACTLALATAIASMMLASRFLRPVARLMDGVSALKSGQAATRIEPTSTDEFGQLTTQFNDMADQIKKRDATIAEKVDGNSQLLKRLFPPAIVDRMVKGERQIVDLVPNVTVIYASVVGFAKSTEDKSPAESMALLSEIFDLFDHQASEHGIDRIKTLGEHYIAACGLSEARLDHAQRAVAYCDSLSRELRRLSKDRNLRLDLRASLASGDINSGLVGDRRFVFEIWGKPLNFVRRLVHETPTGEVRITETTYALLGANSGFTERPTVEGRTLGPIVSFGRRLGDLPVKLEQAAE